MVARPSLRTRLLRDVLLPLFLTWTLGTLVVVSVAYSFTQSAFDDAMIDDAYLLASKVEMQGGAPVLNLTPSDLRTVLFDQRETVYFAVQRADGRLIAGQPGLVAPSSKPGAETQFIDLDYQGRPLRGVVLDRASPLPLRVIVALTTSSRAGPLNRLLLFSVVPQVLLLILLAIWLQRGIRRDLAPLSALQHKVEQRDAADLTPLPAALDQPVPTREVQGLAGSINALLARIAEGVSAQREFAGNVAHELRTPLAGIRAAADYGLSQDDPQRWREQLQAVLASQQRASHLIDQMLALALADEAHNSRALQTLQPLQLGELAREVVLQFLARADKAGVDLGASGLELPLSVRADRALLEGLLANLLDNALRYGRPETGPAVVSVDLSRQADGIWLSVSDNGPGIPPEQREALCSRWAQGPGGQRLGVGAGLGLSIVERYAQLMRARLQLDSGSDGRGLRASVVFPV